MDQKRTIEELRTLYFLEPDVCDVYVEGTTDQLFIDWYLKRKGHSNATVYPIDVIAISEDILASNGLSKGSNRAKVIALSCELARQQVECKSAMCIIDRDSDDADNHINANPHLYATDGNSMELYAFAPSVIEKFLLVALAGFPIAARNLISSLTSILEVIYSVRQANEHLRFGMQWIPFGSYIALDMNRITFRESDFIRAYLQKNDRWQDRDRFIDIKNSIQQTLSPDATRRMRGHDLAELLHIIVKKFRRDRAFTNSTVLEGCLMASIETRDLEAYPLFVALENHVSVE